MRLNQYLAQHTDLSRRTADQAITDGRVEVNGLLAILGDTVIDSDIVTLDGHQVKPTPNATIMLHKPVGYVCSKNGQGSKTIYDLLPAKFHNLNPIGRLDKDSSGLLLMTNDGNLANKLMHPRYDKQKVYQVKLNKPMSSKLASIAEEGVDIGDDRPSMMKLKRLSDKSYQVIISEGRNRQIRRTFEAVGYRVAKLHRTNFGPYTLDELPPGKFRNIS